MPLAPAESLTWPDAVVQLLDEHHLVVLSDGAHDARDAVGHFGDTLARRLRQMPETQVLEIDGRETRDVPSLCKQIERQLPTRSAGASHQHIAVWWRDVSSVIALLRGRQSEHDASTPFPKHRYIIWHHADAADGLLQRDAVLFDRLVNAVLGVAAEHEHISPDADTLMLQRAVFLGGETLARYASDSRSALNHWLDEEGSPFWEVASVLQRPPVLTYRLE